MRRWVGLGLALWLAASVRLWASSGGAFEISRSLPAAPGSVGEDSGSVFLLVGAFENTGGVLSSTSTLTLLSGYLLYHSSYAAVTAVAAASRVKSRPGWELGVSTGSAVQLYFATAMASSTLTNATSVYLTADNLGNAYLSTVAFTLTYDPALQAALVTVPGGWLWGHSYQIAIGTNAMDMDFNVPASSYTANLLTLMDFSQRNVVRGLGGNASVVDVASSALPGTGVILLVSNPLLEPDRINPAHIQAADATAVANLGPQARSISVSEINAYDSAGNPLGSTFAAPVSLSLPYSESNGLVTGTSGARSKNLALWTLNEPASLWVKVPGSTVGPGQVTVPLRHFSVYGLLAAVDQDVSLVYPFPVPWRPFSGDPVRYGTLAGGITFANPPQSGRIKIYTLSGELVREFSLNGEPTVVWDGKNMLGQNAASAVYLWMVESGSNRKTGKLMIVR